MVIGALATISEIMAHPLVREHLPLLVAAGDQFASKQIRNAATFGGNVCNASPAGDLAMPLLVLDARSNSGSMLDDSHAAGACRWPSSSSAPASTRARNGRVARRRAHAGSAAGLRGALPQVRHAPGARHLDDLDRAGRQRDRERRAPRRAAGARRGGGQTAARAQRHRGAALKARRPTRRRSPPRPRPPPATTRPIDDVRASDWYRKEMLRNMVERMLDDVARPLNPLPNPMPPRRRAPN
ncbi:MAG: FAD binding domain-containing protein [Rhodocyclaceae bacterium]|nr:FAD binding domain-containing protein [Rhodocyclaceae bacterium]